MVHQYGFNTKHLSLSCYFMRKIEFILKYFLVSSQPRFATKVFWGVHLDSIHEWLVIKRSMISFTLVLDYLFHVLRHVYMRIHLWERQLPKFHKQHLSDPCMPLFLISFIWTTPCDVQVSNINWTFYFWITFSFPHQYDPYGQFRNVYPIN